MRIGIIVDGDAESQAWVSLIANINIEGVQIKKPLYVDIQPKATSDQIARKALDGIEILRKKGVDKIVVLMDREDLEICPPDLCKSLEAALVKKGCNGVSVVIKDRKLENWLVADIEALRALPGRFSVTNAFENRVRPNLADGIADAESILNSIVVQHGRRYHKLKDAQAIMAKQDIVRVAKNSRSFRRFLKVLNHPLFAQQEHSKKPLQ